MLGHHSSMSAPIMQSGLSTGDGLGMSGKGRSGGGTGGGGGSEDGGAGGGGGGGEDSGAGGGSTTDFTGSKLARSALARLALFRLIAASA